MRVESPISDESSVRLILTRARGLGILTFDKIKKKAFYCIYYHFILHLFLFVTKQFFFSPLFSLLARIL